ncbi:hypothetical protein ACJ73_04883 [Blastomyces percursus]|uniref:Transcription elongation factor 1 homolog n=1 Tax=Blastomyces percursus TaxID=1658174 RepID=A0A1J9R804_9EURO|nr:hypothetical protein ACJ73_04883 [Blastomyces percursus]
MRIRFQTGINCEEHSPFLPLFFIVLPLTAPPAMALDLSAAVDVYSDWVDACDAVAKDAAAGNDVDTTARGANEGSLGPVRREAEREEFDEAEVGLDDY